MFVNVFYHFTVLLHFRVRFRFFKLRVRFRFQVSIRFNCAVAISGYGSFFKLRFQMQGADLTSDSDFTFRG